MKDTTFLAILFAVLIVLTIFLSFTFQSCSSVASVEICREVSQCL